MEDKDEAVDQDKDVVTEEEEMRKIIPKRKEIKIFSEVVKEERLIKDKLKCYSCGKNGHYFWECQTSKEENKFVVHSRNVKELTLFLTLKKDQNTEDSTWHLDNETSNHMTRDRSKFVALGTNVKGHVHFGDELKVDINGKGRFYSS
ncbi:hypothetical protein S83_002966 [Arachis hypogaea]